MARIFSAPDRGRCSLMRYLQGNLAREVARLTGWEDKIWSRRYQAILVTDEEAAQVDRLKYLLENSCKEGLVDSPIHWPGVHCARALITGDRVEGTWFDRRLDRVQHPLAWQRAGPREFANRGGGPPEPAPLLEAHGAQSVHRADDEPRPGDRRGRRHGMPTEAAFGGGTGGLPWHLTVLRRLPILWPS
jgi:hypothetical protein